jgi:hypothetical protein
MNTQKSAVKEDFTDWPVDKLRQWVEKRAYELYMARGRKPEQDWQDWFRAEKLLIERLLADK